MNEINNEYYHTNESEMFLFYRIPKALFTDDKYKNLSTDAKVLYGLMLDRMGLSVKNNWCDDQDRVYIIYTQDEVIEQLNYKKEKVVKLYKELDDIGLIERKKHGQGRPTWIYVKKFISDDESQSRLPKNRLQDFRNSEVKNSEKQTSRLSEIEILDFRKSNGSNTDLNNTEFIDTDINQSINEIKDDDSMDKMDTYRQIIQDNIEYDILVQNHGESKVDELVELIAENVCFPKKSYYIDNIEYPAEIVKSRLLKLNSSHIDYIFDCMKKNPTKIRNIKNYLIAALYNSFTTMDSYYTAEYNTNSVW